MKQVAFLCLSVSLACAAQAQEAAVSKTVPVPVEAPKKPTDNREQQLAKLEVLFQKIKENPESLDANFAYAQLAGQLGKYDEALASYERMLISRPDLHRVKLDMALIYMKINNFTDSEKLLREVLAINPPEAVQDNIQKMLAEIGTRKQRHFFSGSLTFGWNEDSNGNASPASGNQDSGGVSFPITASGSKTEDQHVFEALALRHSYRFSDPRGHTWQTEGLYYRTKQSLLSNLDVTLKSIKTGSVWVIPTWRSRLGVSVQYTDTNLARADYQQTWRKQAQWTYAMHPKLQLQFTGSHDLKRHHNSASSSLYTLRNGEAWEFKTNATFAYSPKTTFTLGYTNHHEQTTAQYYSYVSDALDFKTLHQLPWYNLSAVGGLTLTHTKYRAPDASVNPTKTRDDNSLSLSLNLSKPLTPTITISGGYTYKETTSNIQNYAYENERWSMSLTKRF